MRYELHLVQDAVPVGGVYTPHRLYIPANRVEYMRVRYGFHILDLLEQSAWRSLLLLDEVGRKAPSTSECGKIVTRLRAMARASPSAWWSIRLEAG